MRSSCARAAMSAAFLFVFAAAGHGQSVTATVAAGIYPNAVGVNPVTNKIYVVNYGGGSVTVIDGATNNTVTVMVGTQPIAVAINPLTNKIYVANFGSGNVTVIDGATNSTANIAAGVNPVALAVNPVTNRIYVASPTSGVTVIDGVTQATSLVPAGTQPRSLAVNPETDKIYVANAISNNVTVIDGATNNTSTVVAGTDPVAIAVNPVSNKIYVANNGSGNVTVIDGATNSVTNVTAGINPNSIAIDPVTNKIYASSPLSNSVTVIDGASNSTGTVSGVSGAFDVAVNATTNQVFVTNGSTGLTVIDGTTGNAVHLGTGTNPGALAVNPVTNKIYVANNGDGVHASTVTLVDGATNVATTLSVPSQPWTVAVNPVTNKIYTGSLNGNGVTVIDGNTNMTTAIPVPGISASIDINPLTNKIYVAAGSAVMVIDGSTNATKSIPTATSAEYVAVNRVTNKIYVVCVGQYDAGTVVVIDGTTDTVLATAVVGIEPLSIAVNEATNRVYVANSGSDTVSVIDGVSNSVATVTVGNEPQALAVNPATNKIYVANYSFEAPIGSVAVIDGATNKVAYVSAGQNPYAVGVNPVTNKIYVANISGSSVTVIDGTSNATTTIPVGTYPNSIAVNLATNKIYVNNADNTVAVIDGATKSTRTITGAGNGSGGPFSVAANPVTGKIYISSYSDNTVVLVDEAQLQAVQPTTTINPLPNNVTTSGTANFTFATNSLTNLIPDGVFFQTDTWQNKWTQATGSNPNFAGTLAALQPGFHILYAYAADGEEATSTQPSSPVTGSIQAYSFVAAFNSGTYLGLDTTTEGSWNGQYGADGFLIANDVSSLPAYATVSITGDQTYTWAAQTSDSRALQTGAGSNSRLASTYYSYPGNSFNININLNDGNVHRVALYLLDWDTTSRAETITITDAGTHMVLDTESFSGFHNGQYAVWNLRGNVNIQVTASGGGNAVVSGLFFGGAGAPSGPPAVPSSMAAYVGQDTSTEGTWTGQYGRDGYDIANESPVLPAYAALSLTGDFTYTWAGLTMDPRALQSASGSGNRIASSFTAYYGSSFSINLNLVDGNVHRVALYLLDWDTTGRSETITIMDAATSTVLDTETFSGFHSGSYAIWNVKGRVVINVSPMAGPSASVSGIFFN